MAIWLSDQQIAHILNVSRPLVPGERREFLAALFEALLMRRDDIGDGELHRTLRDLQRLHFRPPWETEDTRGGPRLRHFTAQVLA